MQDFRIGFGGSRIALASGGSVRLDEVRLGERVLTAPGVEARVQTYSLSQLVGKALEITWEDAEGKKRQTFLPNSTSTMVRREIDYQAAAVRVEMGNLLSEDFLQTCYAQGERYFSPLQWVKTHELRKGDYLFFPYNTTEEMDDLGKVTRGYLVPTTVPGGKPTDIDDRLYLAPWVTYDNDASLDDDLGQYFRIVGIKEFSVEDSLIKLGIDTVGSVVVDGVAIRSRVQVSKVGML